MKIPLQFTCPSCRTPVIKRVHLDATSLDWICEKCGAAQVIVFDLDLTVGWLMLARSWYELSVEKDNSMAIVLAATAFDSELSRLFCKWTQIKGRGPTLPFSLEDCEKKLRAFRTIAVKIEGVSRLLYPGGIEAFVCSSPVWSKEINDDFPSLHIGSLAKDFQETVFWPRNKVLHAGYAQHPEDEASKCYSVADIGLRILKDMDRAKRLAERL